jgi:hypothetical protein
MWSTTMLMVVGGLAWSVEVDDLWRVPFTISGDIPHGHIGALLEAAAPMVPADRQIEYLRLDQRSGDYVVKLIRPGTPRFRAGSQTLYEKHNTLWLRLDCDQCELTRSTVVP